MKTVIIFVAAFLAESTLSVEDGVPLTIEAVSPPVSDLPEIVNAGEIAANGNNKIGMVSPLAIQGQNVDSLDEAKVNAQKENEITITSNADLQQPKSEVNVEKIDEGMNADPQQISSKPIFIKSQPVPKMGGTLFGSVTQNSTPSTIPINQHSTQKVPVDGGSRFPYFWSNYNILQPLFDTSSRIGGLGLTAAGTLIKTVGQVSDTTMNTVKNGSDWIQGNTQFIKGFPFINNFHKPASNLVNTSLDTSHVIVGDTAENVGNSLFDIGESVRKRNDGALDKQ